MHAEQPGSRQTRPPLILVVEDQEWSARSLESILGPRGFAVLRASNGRQALDQAFVAKPDAILLDDGLPDMSGLEVCRQLVADARISTSTPIIMMTTGAETRRRRLEAFRAGAWEFMQLPPDAEELLLRLDTYVRAKLDSDQVGEEGLLDRWSGMYNLRGLLRRAAELGAEAERFERPLACIVFSLETQRSTDPRSGDPAPTFLAEVEEVFRATVRSCDTVGRLGPSQFAVLTPATDSAGALRLAERLIQTVDSATTPRADAQMKIRAGYFGVPNFRDASLKPAELIVRATMALRQGEPALAIQGSRIHSYELAVQPRTFSS